MKLRKDQRHVAYIILKDAFERGQAGCLCWAIADHLSSKWAVNKLIDGEFNIYDFPELIKRKPVLRKGPYWFPENDREQRISILDQCIAETADYNFKK